VATGAMVAQRWWQQRRTSSGKERQQQSGENLTGNQAF